MLRLQFVYDSTGRRTAIECGGIWAGIAVSLVQSSVIGYCDQKYLIKPVSKPQVEGKQERSGECFGRGSSTAKAPHPEAIFRYTNITRSMEYLDRWRSLDATHLLPH